MSIQDTESFTVPVSRWLHTSRRWTIRGDGPTTVCYADLCRFAQGCPSKTLHPRRMPQSRCPRYWPEALRPNAGLPRLVQGLVAQYRVTGGGNPKRRLYARKTARSP